MGERIIARSVICLILQHVSQNNIQFYLQPPLCWVILSGLQNPTNVIPSPSHERLLLFVCWLLPPPHPSLLHYCFPSPSWLSRKQESSVPRGAVACGSNAYITSPHLFTSKAEPIVQGVQLQPYSLQNLMVYSNG